VYGEYTRLDRRYHTGSRPLLEQALVRSGADRLSGSRERAVALLEWTAANVKHPSNLEPNDFYHWPADRDLSEEELIGSGWGWCNEQARTFVALCQVAGMPARMCSLWHADPAGGGHMTTEVHIDGKWCFADASFGHLVELPDGSLASAWEICRDAGGVARQSAQETYRAAAIDICQRLSFPDPPEGLREWINDEAQHQLFAQVGITNYYLASWPVDSVSMGEST
jgi:transglutaminase-like putative cysteine protease